jgi:hypothetical protein
MPFRSDFQWKENTYVHREKESVSRASIAGISHRGVQTSTRVVPILLIVAADSYTMAKQSPFASFAAISPARSQTQGRVFVGRKKCEVRERAFAYRIIAKVVTLVIQQQDV